MIRLIVLPTTPPVSWDRFVKTANRYSVALDGYVSGGPQFDTAAGVASFNHHEGVDRLATRSTCAQVLMAIRQGFFKTFRDHEGPQATVYVNDCDEDVCLSWYLLKNHAVAGQAMNPLLNRLVMMEDCLDATAGAYPFPQDLPVLRELAWVFEPYRQFRLIGKTTRRTGASSRMLRDALAGTSPAKATRYERIGGGTGWTMVKEIGAQARTGMFADGIQAYVSVREIGHARWAYTVGRMSSFIPFDCQRIFDKCNEAEFKHTALKEGLLNLGPPAPDRWGGSEMVGGSPRVEGSKIPPSILENIVEHTL